MKFVKLPSGTFVNLNEITHVSVGATAVTVYFSGGTILAITDSTDSSLFLAALAEDSSDLAADAEEKKAAATKKTTTTSGK